MKKVKLLIITIIFFISNSAFCQNMTIDPSLECMSDVTLDLHNPSLLRPCNLPFDTEGPAHFDGINLGHDKEKQRNHNFGDNETRTLRFKGLFRAECAYDLGNQNQLDWNKLMMINLTFPNSKETSVRLGWRWSLSKQKMELGLYGHINHESNSVGREFLYLTEVDLDTEFDCELILSGIGLGVVVNDKGSFIKREDIYDEGTVKTAYKKSAFFGGQECPPHDMDIEVTDIRGDEITNWHNGACEKTFSRSIFYSYDNFTINAARKITFNEQVYKGQYNSDDIIPSGYNVGDEIPWMYSENERFVTIKSGANITCNAGEIIKLLPGFHAEIGSKFNANITNSISCSNFVRSPIISTNNPNENAEITTNHIDKSLTKNEIDTSLKFDKYEDLKYKVYPNPTNEKLTVSIKNTEYFEVIIFDMIGNILIKTQFDKSKITLDLSLFPSGIYVLNVKTKNDVYVTKIIKE